MAFTPDQAQRWILYAGIVSGGLTLAGQTQRNRSVPNVRVVAGTFAAVVILSAVAEAEPQVAGTFAILMLVVAVGGAGPELLAKVTGQRPGAGANVEAAARNPQLQGGGTLPLTPAQEAVESLIRNSPGIRR